MIVSIILSFMKIGILAFGGAYAAIPLVEKEIVELRQWMTYEEFADLLALDELTPGPILINSATFVGMKVGGLSGAVAASIGCILPACLISLMLCMIYRKYKKLSWMESIIHTLKCMAIALIVTSFIRIVIKNSYPNEMISYLGIVLMAISFFVLRKYKINPLYLMLGCGLISVLCSLI